MKLSQYAKKAGITYKAAYEQWRKGILRGCQLPTGTIVVTDKPEELKRLINVKNE